MWKLFYKNSKNEEPDALQLLLNEQLLAVTDDEPKFEKTWNRALKDKKLSRLSPKKWRKADYETEISQNY